MQNIKAKEDPSLKISLIVSTGYKKIIRISKCVKVTSWQLILQSTTDDWDPNIALLHGSIARLTSKPEWM